MISLYNRIGGVIVNVAASSAVDRGFESRSGQTKDCKIGICCFSAKHAALRSKNQGRLNSIIGHREKQYTRAPTYTTTLRNKNVNGR